MHFFHPDTQSSFAQISQQLWGDMKMWTLPQCLFKLFTLCSHFQYQSKFYAESKLLSGLVYSSIWKDKKYEITIEETLTVKLEQWILGKWKGTFGCGAWEREGDKSGWGIRGRWFKIKNWKNQCSYHWVVSYLNKFEVLSVQLWSHAGNGEWRRPRTKWEWERELKPTHQYHQWIFQL